MSGNPASEGPAWSPKTGKVERSAEPIAAPAPEAGKLKGARKGSSPCPLAPSLATLVSKAPSGSRWLHEIKFDGYRLQARIEAGRVKPVRLVSCGQANHLRRRSLPPRPR